MNNLWLQGRLRDYWPFYAPAAIHNLSWLNSSDCFIPKVFGAPREGLVNFSASGYVIEVLSLKPGSWIYGLAENNAGVLDMQITDTEANYQFFSSPCPVSICTGFRPFFLPEPYMVAGAGLIRVELWNNTTTATTTSQVEIYVMEPRGN
jgi:hypothetical protein